MKQAATVLASLILLLFALLATRGAQQSSTQQKDQPSAAAARQAPKSGPEMEKMKFLIGEWTMYGEYLKSPIVPQGGKQTGMYTARLGPGGFSLIADFDADGPFGREIGHQVIAWDPKQNYYTVITVGNNFPGALVGVSRWEGANLVTRTEFNDGGTVVHMRSQYTDIKEKSTHIEEYFQAGDSPEQLLWKADAVKK